MDRVFAEGHTAKGFPLIARFAQVPMDGPAPTRVAWCERADSEPAARTTRRFHRQE